MKIDITALRGAAKKFATTLDAHRANPRDAHALYEWDEATSALTTIVGGDENNIIVALLDALEAERQRADNWSVSFENERFRADKLAEHIEALKGDQVPVAWTDAEELRGMEKDGCGYLFKVDPANPFADPRRQIMLYDHPQKPV
ncbi:hypothetical protein ACE2AK_04100 [Rahnella perminowiae]|uniref:hypothetical protein n=1 Tax=Rahnella perminowiae TaxID=2816244 RepID=UPI00364EF313